MAELRTAVGKFVDAVAVGKLNDAGIASMLDYCAEQTGVPKVSAPPLTVNVSEADAALARKVELPWPTAVGCAADYFSQGGYETPQGSPSPAFEAMIARARLLDPSYSYTRTVALARALAEVRNKDISSESFAYRRSEENIAWSTQCEGWFNVKAPLSAEKARLENADLRAYQAKQSQELARGRAALDAVRNGTDNGMGNNANYADLDGFLSSCMNLPGDLSPTHPDYGRWRKNTWDCEDGRKDGIRVANSNNDNARANYYRGLRFPWQ